MAREIADKLVASGKVVRPWLGIGIQALSENKEYAELNKDVKEGVVVTEINRDTPAAASDLKQADIIVAVDGKRVGTPKELQLEVLGTKVGQKLTLDVVRGSKTIQVTVQTAEMPDRLHAAARRAPGKSPGESAFGLTIQTLTNELAERLKVGETEGVLVTDVADGSIAAEKGFQRADVITEVDRAPVRNTAEFKAAMDKADPKKGVLVFFKRGGASAFVVLKEK
jgi:S1-C subfamily serine protease